MEQFGRPPQRDSWFAPLSVDLFLKVLSVTLLHPFVAWIIPLCFRAQVMSYESLPMRLAIGWAGLLTLAWMAGVVNKRMAYGLPRHVDFSDEVIVVTGGASGLGLLIAEVYGMRGASVAVLDVREMENGESRGVTYYRCDVSDKSQVARTAVEIERDLGAPTILINNAGIVVGKTLLDMDIEEVEKSISTNLLAHFYTLKAFLPSMVRSEEGATIVTLSSVIGKVGAAQLTDYAAAKAGLIGLHKSLTAELAASHPQVRTVLVTPGQLSTPLFYGVRTPSAFFAPVVEPVDVAKEIIAAIDDGRAGDISMPLYARMMDWYNILPIGLQKLARTVAGVDTAMAGFIGRKGIELGRKNGGAR